MRDEDRPREELLAELTAMRQRVSELEAMETRHRTTEEALAHERNLLRTLIDNLPDRIFIKNTESQFVINNAAHLYVLGAKTTEEVIGKTDFDYFPQELASRYYADERQVLQTGQSLINYEEPTIDQSTSHRRWLSTTKVPLRDNQGRVIGLVGMSRDITERKRAEAALAQRAAQLALINDIGSKIAAVLELDSLLDRAARLIQEMFGYHHVALFLLDGEVARLKAIAGSYRNYFPPNHSQKLSQGIIGWVATNGERIVANDIAIEPRYISLIPDRTETRAELCLPIKIALETVGVLDIQSPHLHAFGENDIIAMKILTDQIAVAIENVRLYEAVQQELAERRRAEEELNRYKDHLEELVEERTAKLKAANEQLHQEIVERRRIEQALRESESKYRMLMEQASDGIFLADQQGNYLEVNPKAYKMLGYTQAEILEFNWRHLIPAEDLIARPFRMDEVLSGKTLLIERNLYRKDGRLLPVEISAKVLEDGRVQAIVRDITERKRAEEELRRYAKRLKILQEIDRAILAAQSPEAIAAAAMRRLQQLIPCLQASVIEFDFKNQEAVILTAYHNSEPRIGAGTRLPLSMFQIAGELRQGSVHVASDQGAVGESRSAVPALQVNGVRSHIDVPLIAAEELIGIIKLQTDRDACAPEHIDIALEVADQLAVAIQQARLHEQVQRHALELEGRVAERTARLQEINDELESFTYSVSHDLRAPLRGIQGFATVLLEDYAGQLDEDGQEYCQRIVMAAQRMDQLIQDLLAYSRLSRADLRLQPIHLTTVITDVMNQLESELQEQSAQVSIVEPLPPVVGHHATLVQVIANLLTNAIKFVTPGVRPQVRVYAEERDPWVRLAIEDNGIGIEPQYQERIFRIFERLHGIDVYPGTGIGLAIVRKGLTRMGGQAGVESALGQGSTFWLELPRVKQEG